ncbi:MAG: DUF2249 domain-containing protein [Cyclobacteriaceae bacterium]|nr:DUF2249 domain-containing protein [Cyclobacteriaceae bacterium]
MTTILETLAKLGDDEALFVKHKRVPVYLLPELSDRHMEYRIKELGDNDVELLIFKKKI